MLYYESQVKVYIYIYKYFSINTKFLLFPIYSYRTELSIILLKFTGIAVYIVAPILVSFSQKSVNQNWNNIYFVQLKSMLKLVADKFILSTTKKQGISSTKRLAFVVSSVKRIIYVDQNKNGLKIDPCGTPASILDHNKYWWRQQLKILCLGLWGLNLCICRFIKIFIALP